MNAKQLDLLNRIRPTVICNDIQLVSKYDALLNIGEHKECHGVYYQGSIILNNSIVGIEMVDTVYHEDRHHQQHIMQGRYRIKDFSIPYKLRPWEVDARRYAYVSTVRFIKI